MTEDILLTGEPGLLEPTVVGNKFARLESMRLAGFPVPALFCLPAARFDDAVAGLRLPPLPPTGSADVDPVALRAWSEAAEKAVTGLLVPRALATRLQAAFQDLVGADGLVAVRACVVPAPGEAGEDDAGDPFAGISESFLYVPAADLLARVLDCWASAYRAEAVLYRLRRGDDPTAARIAVGVQRMVLGTRSFVAFTRDPRNGARRHLIAAAHGIGEGVVQEKADVDHFFVAGDGRVHAEVVAKRRMVGPPLPGGSEPAALPVPTALAAAPVLDDEQVHRIVAVAERIEEHFGAAQDIEGTIDATGELFVVQARPMVLPAPEVTPAAAGQIPWSNHNITESYPGVSGALTYTVARDFYRLIFTDLYRRVGVPERRLRANAHHLQRMVGLLDGRVYYRLDAWFALHGQMREFEFVRGWWEHGMGLSDDVTGPPPRPGRRLRALRIAPRVLAGALRHPGQVRRMLDWWDSTAAAANTRLDAAGPEELVAFHRRLWAEVGVRWGVTLTNNIYSILVTVALDRLLRRWAGQTDRMLLLGLLSGGPDNRTLSGLRSAIALGELCATNPPLRQRLLDADDEDRRRTLWADIVAGRYGATEAAAFGEHLRRYGDRAAGDLKLEQPTPRQRPWMVLDMVRPQLRQGRTVAASRADEKRVRRDVERQLRRACRNPLRRFVLLRLAAAQRWYVKAREDTRFCRTELYGLTRRVLLRLGAELAADGHLDAGEDVFDLTVDEVLGAFEGTLPCAELRHAAAMRSAERLRHATLPEPPVLQVTAAGTALATPAPAGAGLPDPVARAGSGDVLRGLASSPGVVRGRARVLRDPSVSPEECRDRILVARETDPGWLFLMTVATGMVVERGNVLSHTAITGRLLGVPTVVAVPGATELIPDGALIELDGATGSVRVLAGAPA